MESYEYVWMIIDTPLNMLVGGCLALAGVALGAHLWGGEEDLDEY